MTRKDYELLAGVVSAVEHRRQLGVHENDEALMSDLRITLASELAGDNPRFDHERFLAACEPESV